MDNQKDSYIKEKLEKDVLISKKADDVFNNFLKGDLDMEKENEVKTKDSSKRKSKFKKILATAASIVIVFGAANVYATTQGYSNIFFMIKYLVSGDDSVVFDKEAILSDRDITISYEPIKLTENISIQIKNLQIKDNEAKLFVIVNEKEYEKNTKIVPLTYEVYNSSNDKLCEQVSSKEENESMYTEELKLTNLKNDDKVINLKIYNSNKEIMTSLTIDLDNKTIEVEGEKEALKKISEIELKEFLGRASGLYNDSGKLIIDDEKICFAIELLASKDKLETIDFNDNNTYYDAELIDDVLESFNDIKIDNYSGEWFKTVNKNNKKYYKVLQGVGLEVNATCMDVSNISYCAGTYTATYTYCRLGFGTAFDVDINDFDIYQTTVTFILNSDDIYSTFKLKLIEEPELIKSKNDKEDGSVDISNNSTSNTNSNSNTINTNTTNNTVTSSNNSSTSSSSTKVDNYASTMSWTEYWAPGIKFSYPSIFTLKEEGGDNRGNNQGGVSTIIEGVATGINPDTKEIINSNVTIKIYEPEVGVTDVNQYKLSENGINNASLTTKNGLTWYYSNVTTDENGVRTDTLTCISDLDSGKSIVHKITISTDKPDNYKVLNISNWLLGTTKITSY